MDSASSTQRKEVRMATVPVDPKFNPSSRLTEAFFVDSFVNSGGDFAKHCAGCLLGCLGCFLGVYNHDGSIAPLPNLSKHIIFCTTVTHVLTRPRTSQELSSFISRLGGECTCDLNDSVIRNFHDFGTAWEKSYRYPPALMLIMQLFYHVGIIPRTASKVVFAKGKAKDRWPSTTEDMFPHGITQTVETIGKWSLLLPEPAALMFLSGCLVLAGQKVFTAITASNVTGTLLKHLISTLRSACKRARSCKRPYSRMQIILPIPPIAFIIEFIFRVMNERTSQNSLTDWVRGYENDLLLVFSEVISIARNQKFFPIESDKDMMLAQFCVNIPFYFSTHFSMSSPRPEGLHPELTADTPVLPDWIKQLNLPAPSEEETMYSNLFYWFLDIRKKQCHVSGCKKQLQDIGPSLRKCSSCGIITYCSRECQAADWNAAEFSHKEICPKIQTFFKACGGIPDVNRTNRIVTPEKFDYEMGRECLYELDRWNKYWFERREQDDLPEGFRELLRISLDEDDDEGTPVD